MRTAVLALLCLLDLAVLSAMLAYLLWWTRELFLMARGVPPFVRTRTAVADEAAALFGTLPDGSVLYDLGCGDGRVLRAVARANPRVRCIGLEFRRVPLFLARWHARRERLPNVSFRRADFFRTDLSDATRLYTYLLSPVMDRLLPKLEKELSAGALLVSLDFPFTRKEAARSVPVRAAGSRQLGRTFYIYEF